MAPKDSKRPDLEGYEVIGEEEQPARAAPKRSLALGVIALAAISAVAAIAAPHSTKVAAVQSLYKASAPCATCDCASGVAGQQALAAVTGATAAPTAAKYWHVYWSDGKFDDSYIWWTNEEKTGKEATVLVDSLGVANGIDIDTNATTVYFTVDGCIGRVDTDGYDLKELFCYDDTDVASDMQGLALYEWDGTMYWVDKTRNTLYGANMEGAHAYWVVDDDFDTPIDVAVDERAAKLYVSDSTGIYKMDQDGSDKQLVLSADQGLSDFKGLDIDAVNRELYFAATEGSEASLFMADIFDPSNEFSAVYKGLSKPMGVAARRGVSNTEELVFFVDSTGLYQGDLTGAEDAEYVAAVDDARFVCVLAESAPSAAPTPVPSNAPSSEPSFAPSSHPSAAPAPAPTSAPSSFPTAAPAPAPSKLPTAAPSLAPVPAPSKLPTAAPSALPTFLPSAAPSSFPSAAPVPAPSAAPVPAPSLVPTSAPTTQCQINMNECGYCNGEAGSECAGEPQPTAKPVTETTVPTTAGSTVFTYLGESTWEGCREICAKADLQMPCVIGPTMDDNLQKSAESADLSTVWLGYQSRPDMDPSDVSSWDWQLGCPSFYNDWAEGEPNDYGDGEECASMAASSGEWNDLSCESTTSCMCQGDSTAPTAVPLSETTAPTTVGSSVFTNFGAQTWEGCRATCAAADLTMPCIIGPSMNKNLDEQLDADKVDSAWLGYQSKPDMDPSDVDSWGWQLGCPSFFNDWSAGEPNDYGDGEECASIYASTGAWNDLSCTSEIDCYCQGAAPSAAPSAAPTQKPISPTAEPTAKPFPAPTGAPAPAPTPRPSARPTEPAPTAVRLSDTGAPTTAGSTVFTYEGEATFEGCVETCAKKDLQMPCVISPSMNKNLDEQLDGFGVTKAWLGYQSKPDMDAADVDAWGWQMGCPSFFNDWTSGMPETSIYNEDVSCATIETGMFGEWMSVSCEKETSCVCQGDDAPTGAPTGKQAEDPNDDDALSTTMAPTTAGSTVFTYVGDMDFEGCVSTCEGYGVTMPCILSPTMDAVYSEQLVADGNGIGWLGYAAKTGMAAEDPANWAWQVGCPSFYADWYAGQPEDAPFSDDDECAASLPSYISSTDEWADGACTLTWVPCYCQGEIESDVPVVAATAKTDEQIANFFTSSS